MNPIILVVEREKNLREFYKSELEREGYDVLTTSNGHQALRTMRHEDVSLIVLALILPDGSGLDYLQKMMSVNRSVPVVINTDYPTGRMDFNSWLADAYLLKSDDLTELKRTIDYLLKSSEASF